MHQKRKKRNSRHKKSAVFGIFLGLLLGFMITGTGAFLLDASDPVTNTFQSSKITTTVEETLEGGTKSNVSIKNTGDTDAWIRAKVIITWQDERGNVYGSEPAADKDYTIQWNIAEKADNGPCWIEGSDGFYYWTGQVAPEGSTGILIKECKYQKDRAPEGYALTVEIIASGIQSRPANVFDTEWQSSGLKVDEATNSLVKNGKE